MGGIGIMGNQWVKRMEQDVNEIVDSTKGKLEVGEVKYRAITLITYKYISENQGLESNIVLVPEEYSWGQVTRSGINITKRLMEALQEIEKQNPSIGGLFTQFSFDKLLDEDLFKIVSIFNRYSFDEKRNEFPSIGDFAQKMVHVILEKEGTRGGEVSSPIEIAILLPRLLDIKKGTVSDPTSGIGDFLLEAYKYAEKTGAGAVHLCGQEINKAPFLLSKMLLILHGLLDPAVADVKLGNTITDPKWTEGDYLKQFDYVLMNFPFALKNWGHEKVKDDLYGRFVYGTPSASYGDMAFVLHALATLKKDGKAAVIVPHGVLIRGGQEEKIRARLLQEDVIEAVIGLPANLFLGTGIGTSILVLNKNKEAYLRNKVLFIQGEEDFEKRKMKSVLRQQDLDKIVTTYLGKNELESYSKIVDGKEIQQNEFSLLPSRFFAHNEVETKIGEVVVNQNKYNTLPLKKARLTDVVEVNRGILLSKDDEEAGDRTHKMINLVDIQDGKLRMEQLAKVSLNDERKRSKYELLPGDILVSARGTALKMIIIPETEEKLLCSSNFMFLRIKEGKSFTAQYIKAFLESPVGINYIQAYQRGGTVTVLSPKDMKNIELPVIPLEQQEEIVSRLKETEEEYERVINEAQEQFKARHLEAYKLMGIRDTFE